MANLDDAVRQHLLERGGALQRDEVLRGQGLAQAAQAGVASVLAERLLLLVGWGLVSANTAQWLAAGALEDGPVHKDVEAMASWGAEGKYAGNCRRDMMRRFCSRLVVPPPMYVAVPLKTKALAEVAGTQAVLNPLEVMQSIYTNYPGEFKRLFVPTSPRSFWAQVLPDDPRLTLYRDDMDRIPGWRDRAIPFLLHGGGAQFVTKTANSLMCGQWKSMLAENFSDSIFPLCAVPKDVAVKKYNAHQSTMDIIWTEIVHLFNAGYKGRHPDVDSTGRPWARHTRRHELAGTAFLDGDYFLVFWGGLGDLEWLSNHWRLPHFNSLEPCWYCAASRREGTQYPITSVGPGSAWRETIMPYSMGCAIRPSDHPVLDLFGATRYHFPGDYMHTHDLGILTFFWGLC